MADLKEIEEQSAQAVSELLEVSRLEEGDLFVVGCSSSEVLGEKIGTHTSLEVAEAVYRGITRVLKMRGIRLAAQCCEHLNRALVVERETCRAFSLEQVNAIPQPDHAGGAFATTAWKQMKDPVLVESLEQKASAGIEQKASAGIDIGQTLIGMHIHPVVVPVRVGIRKIGEAVVTCARRRPKYVGGQRAIYDERLM